MENQSQSSNDDSVLNDLMSDSFRDNGYFAGAALDALPVHVAVLDIEGNILAVNKA